VRDAIKREAQRIYNVHPQQIIVFSDKIDFETVREAMKCGITLYVPISVFAGVEKHQDQKADAKADISPTVDITP